MQEIDADSGVDPLRRLASLLSDGVAAQSLAQRLRLSNNERDRLAALLSPPGAINAELVARALRREVYAHGVERIVDWLILVWAKHRNDGARYRQLIAAAKDWTPAILPIKGADALTLGLTAGPDIGDLLKAVERWWIDEDFAPTRAECLEKLSDLAAARAN